MGWIRGILVAVVLFAAVFGVAEVALRIAGYGYETSFFRKTTIAGNECWVENTKFGFRFFPREIARVPSPVIFPVHKGSNTFRIFLLGESAALGDPEPAFGVGRFLKALLEQRFPEMKFEVIPAAMTAINSHALLPIARECARMDGDLWIVYMGNNEFVGPFGASTVFGAKAPPRWLVRANLALKATRVGQALDALQDKMAKGKTAKEWGSLKMFAQGELAMDDPRRSRVYENFKKNFEEILSVGKRAGVPVIASSVVVNLKDCAPFASLHPNRFSDTQKAEWEAKWAVAKRGLGATNLEQAIGGLRDALQSDPTYAEASFQLGRCYLASSNQNAALMQFEFGRDHDALPFRADSMINTTIKDAATIAGVKFVDAAKLIDEKIPGEELLYEHVHLNFEGNYRLAKIFGEEAIAAAPGRLKKTDGKEWASFDDCSRWLALNEWDERRVYEEVGRRMMQAPFAQQSNHTNQVKTVREKLAEIRTRMTAARLAEVKEWYAEALKRDASDYYVRGNFAKLLEDNNDVRGAVAQWEEVRNIMPHEPVAYFNEGKLLGQVGEYDRAMTNLARALEISPQLVEAMDEEGKVLLRAGRAEEALKVLQKLAEMRPNNSRVRVGMAEALARLNRRAEATRQLEMAVELQPTNWEARYLLGVELATQNKIKEAREQFEEVVRLRPDYALAHLNLGVALAKEQRLREAAAEFQQTLRLEPTNARARGFLDQLSAVR
ncbi:MAG TPA: tetratricopeptide repeat protein [Verrucomicrobiae bacterium]